MVMATDNISDIRNMLERHRQGHLLAFWDELDRAQRQSLLSQIGELDFNLIDRWAAELTQKASTSPIPADLAPAVSYRPSPTDELQRCKYMQAIKLGDKLISSGKVAVFVVAGGQGTRLGFDGPKGDFPISPVKKKTLFRLFAETISAVSRRYKVTCPWYIMTSPINHDRTMGIFRSNDYYGLDRGDVFMFQQGVLPNFDLDGRILLAGKDGIALSPDGHGGSLRALYRSGALEDMKKRGVEYISYFQVDNPLVNILDPLFVGLHVLDGSQMSSKALVKTGPMEKVGNFCSSGGKAIVIEYSDLPDELAKRRNPDGSLLFELGSIAVHVMSVGFVEELNSRGFALPLHRAVKKIQYIDRQGRPVEPPEPNGIKLESFVFDALPLADKTMILQTLRSEEFGPVKNTYGADSIDTARALMAARAADWLESAGVVLPKKADGSVDAVIEIAPSFALNRGDVAKNRSLIPAIKAGDRVYLE